MTSELSAFLVRQRIHEFMRQFMDLGENCTFFPREGGLRIPWSMPGAVHTWNSEHYFNGPVYLVFICHYGLWPPRVCPLDFALTLLVDILQDC